MNQEYTRAVIDKLRRELLAARTSLWYVGYHGEGREKALGAIDTAELCERAEKQVAKLDTRPTLGDYVDALSREADAVTLLEKVEKSLESLGSSRDLTTKVGRDICNELTGDIAAFVRPPEET